MRDKAAVGHVLEGRRMQRFVSGPIHCKHRCMAAKPIAAGVKSDDSQEHRVESEKTHLISASPA